jgi:hypothetical protein
MGALHNLNFRAFDVDFDKIRNYPRPLNNLVQRYRFYTSAIFSVPSDTLQMNTHLAAETTRL